MNKRFLILLHILIIGGSLQGQTPIANYQINVTLDPKAKSLTGEEILEWTNTSPVEVTELQFHLYLNAFRDQNSTFMKESGGRLRSDVMDSEGFGNIYFTSIKTSSGTSLLKRLNFIQPDDQNREDRTVASLLLPEPVQPGETIRLNIEFKAKLPKVFARTGWGRDNFFMVGQWFPKIGVFEKNDNGAWEWNCHQFHANTEFYADFGKYNVQIRLPEEYKVGATGVQTSEIKLKGGLKQLTFRAEQVHDFAFTASPHYLIFETTHLGIRLRAFMQPEHASQHARYFDAAKKSIDYYTKTLGKYPYETLTLVDPPFHSSGAGGMEYPMLITCGSYWGLGKWQRLPEIVTVHEFGHQYFQGMLASNEFEQSFMDEGFNQYMEGRIMDETYGKGSQLNLLGFTVGDMESSRLSYASMEFPELSEIDRKAWTYPKGTYPVMTYTKTATVLKTLENYLGRAKMDRVLKTYFETYKFKHPTLTDFEGILNQVTGTNYSRFIDDTFRKPYSCDYAIDSVKFDGKAGQVFISRKGKLSLPMDISLSYADGSSELIAWNGEEARKNIPIKKELTEIRLDPQRKNLLDLNLVNNSWTNEKLNGLLGKYTAKMTFWLQHVVLAFLFWIG